jgi:hypothetical protein
MFGPPALISDAVNSVLRSQKLWFERQMFLLRVENVHYAPPSLRKGIAEAYTIEQAAREAGLETSEIDSATVTPGVLETVAKNIEELNSLLGLCGLSFA